MKKLILAGAFLFVTNVYALDIPLTGTGGGPGGGKIGYVDMERIFQVYPQTKAAKDDYRKRLEKLKLDLAQKETELGNIRDRIAVLDATLKNLSAGTVDLSSAAAAVPTQPENLTALKADLEAKQAEFEEARKRAMEDLAAFERNQSQAILGKIYQALLDLAQEEQLALVVDKSSILYGAADTDLTEKLQQRIRGF